MIASNPSFGAKYFGRGIDLLQRNVTDSQTWSPTGKARGTFIEIPSYACLREALPPKAFCGGQALRRTQAKASEGYPPRRNPPKHRALST